jgi:tyrosyl-tRNA synthetase
MASWKWRGLVYDATEGLRQLLDRECVTVYSGFDPTASSLHVGHLLPARGAITLQRLGHHPLPWSAVEPDSSVIPSGKNTERALLSVEPVEGNVASIRQQLARSSTLTRRPIPHGW